ncbi:metallophosphoesterase [Lactobacillus sp. CBA3606]|uniref:metallophosphoesterase family protein n=1 Tax=Lactobacillus sp. CBA3606 TaxID=2099789 RepID=UPI000CFD5789|nr:metallophosphoesterase [Lactobacillus sp. CBA3606]AVK63195.1 metallophosphoesterase [Lactobacillus sp. CBA3606]
MKVKATVLGSLVIAALLLLTGCHQATVTTLPAVKKPTITAMVISDDHVIAPRLHDNGPAFKSYAASDAGADLKYSATIFKAFIATALTKKPDVVIVSGDITNNGEKASHEYVAQQLNRLIQAHIRVYVVPGNHDINNPLTRRFKGKKQAETVAVSPSDFKHIYKNAGYQQATETDKNSLSYLVKPSQKTWFLMLDSAIYRSNYQQGSSTVGGGFNAGTLDWIAKVGRAAKKQHATLIPVMHHNLMDHTAIHQNYTIGYADEVQQVFAKAGIKLALTGHLHAQNIKQMTTNGQSLTDIASGALILGSHYYGTLKLNQTTGTASYQAQATNVDNYIRTHQGAAAVQAYQKYDHDVLFAAGYNAALQSLLEDPDLNYSTKQTKTLATGMAAANIAVFRGTAVQASANITAWEKLPKSTPLRQFVLATRHLSGNLT